jgi:hypothetical protein
MEEKLELNYHYFELTASVSRSAYVEWIQVYNHISLDSS